MKYVRAKDQKDIKVGSMVRLLPTMGWRQTPTNPIGGIGVVAKVRIGTSGIHVRWSNGVDNDGYILGRDILRLTPTKGLQLKFKNVKVSIL